MVLVDTNVYIRAAAGALPAAAMALVERALLFHGLVCLGKLAIGVANADPAGPDGARFRTMTRHRSERCPRAGSSSQTARSGATSIMYSF